MQAWNLYEKGEQATVRTLLVARQSWGDRGGGVSRWHRFQRKRLMSDAGARVYRAPLNDSRAKHSSPFFK